MADMKCRLIVDATPINARVVEILRKTLGDKEALELAETDCIAYIVKRMLEAGWFTKKFPKCNTGLVSKEHMQLVLSDYMLEDEAVIDGDLEIDAVDLEHYKMTYDLTATMLSNDQELIALVNCIHSTITPSCAEYAYRRIDKQVWVLDYIVRV